MATLSAEPVLEPGSAVGGGRGPAGRAVVPPRHRARRVLELEPADPSAVAIRGAAAGGVEIDANPGLAGDGNRVEVGAGHAAGGGVVVAIEAARIELLGRRDRVVLAGGAPGFALEL